MGLQEHIIASIGILGKDAVITKKLSISNLKTLDDAIIQILESNKEDEESKDIQTLRTGYESLKHKGSIKSNIRFYVNQDDPRHSVILDRILPGNTEIMLLPREISKIFEIPIEGYLQDMKIKSDTIDTEFKYIRFDVSAVKKQEVKELTKLQQTLIYNSGFINAIKKIQAHKKWLIYNNNILNILETSSEYKKQISIDGNAMGIRDNPLTLDLLMEEVDKIVDKDKVESILEQYINRALRIGHKTSNKNKTRKVLDFIIAEVYPILEHFNNPLAELDRRKKRKSKADSNQKRELREYAHTAKIGLSKSELESVASKLNLSYAHDVFEDKLICINEDELQFQTKKRTHITNFYYSIAKLLLLTKASNLIDNSNMAGRILDKFKEWRTNYNILGDSTIFEKNGVGWEIINQNNEEIIYVTKRMGPYILRASNRNYKFKGLKFGIPVWIEDGEIIISSAKTLEPYHHPYIEKKERFQEITLDFESPEFKERVGKYINNRHTTYNRIITKGKDPAKSIINLINITETALKYLRPGIDRSHNNIKEFSLKEENG